MLAGLLIVVPKASASTLTKTSILELGGSSFANPMIASDGQQLAVDFKTVAAGANTVSINFNNFSGGTVNGTQSVSSTGCATYFPSATPLAGTLAASGSSNTITVTGISPNLSATTEYCVILTSTTAVTNPSTPAVYSALVTVGSDSQNAAFDVLSSGSNAYSITGTVAPTFTMSLSTTTDTFPGNLSAAALTLSSGVTATVNTNAPYGWGLYAMDSNAGLHSTTAGHTVNSVSTGSNHTMNGGTIGTEAYALGISANATANYAYGGGTTGGGLSSSAYNEVASSASAANGVTQVFHELADISPTTQAGNDYTDTITVIGAGQF